MITRVCRNCGYAPEGDPVFCVVCGTCMRVGNGPAVVVVNPPRRNGTGLGLMACVVIAAAALLHRPAPAAAPELAPVYAQAPAAPAGVPTVVSVTTIVTRGPEGVQVSTISTETRVVEAR
jgi:hypothetical protein